MSLHVFLQLGGMTANRRWWPNCQTILAALSLLFWHFINTTAYHLGRYEPLSPSTKELHEPVFGSKFQRKKFWWTDPRIKSTKQMALVSSLSQPIYFGRFLTKVDEAAANFFLKMIWKVGGLLHNGGSNFKLYVLMYSDTPYLLHLKSSDKLLWFFTLTRSYLVVKCCSSHNLSWRKLRVTHYICSWLIRILSWCFDAGRSESLRVLEAS